MIEAPKDTKLILLMLYLHSLHDLLKKQIANGIGQTLMCFLTNGYLEHVINFYPKN